MTRIDRAKTLKLIHDDFCLGDTIYVPVVKNLKGERVLKGCFRFADPWVENRCPTFRIPIPIPKKVELDLHVGDVWCGTIKHVSATKRMIELNGSREVVEVRLKNLQRVSTSKRYEYFRCDKDLIVEFEEIMVKDMHIAKIYWGFDTSGISNEILEKIPELNRSKNSVVIKQLGKKAAHPSMNADAKERLLNQLLKGVGCD